MIKNLNRRNMEAFYCPTGKEAVKKVSELIADGSTVTWGGTATVRDLGIPEVLKNRGTLEVLDRDLAETSEEKEAIYLRAFSADVYLTSANAISEDGVIVNIDGNGNRVAAITWGPKKVIFVIGLNKVAQTVEAALARARSTASPVMPSGSTSIPLAGSTALAITATRRRAFAATSTSCVTAGTRGGMS